jgi:hypothetical protein
VLEKTFLSRAIFAKCKLRVFVLANKDMDLEEQARNMALMLKKFRITFQQVNSKKK